MLSPFWRRWWRQQGPCPGSRRDSGSESANAVQGSGGLVQTAASTPWGGVCRTTVPTALVLWCNYWIAPGSFFPAVLRIPCFVWADGSCSEQGLLSRCGGQASHCGGFSCCREAAPGTRASLAHFSKPTVSGLWALLPRGPWNLPGLGTELVSPALRTEFLTTEPPGKLCMPLSPEDSVRNSVMI